MGQLTKNEIFALAVQRYSDTVFRAAMHNCSCTADAEDVVQDVFEKLLCYNGRFESEEHLKAWLLRVTINRCHDLTRAARQKDTELDENLPAPDQMEDGSVLDAVRALPENYRNAVYLHYYEGYTAAEVGRMLGTFAPEAGSQRLRDVMNKNITEEAIFKSCKIAFEGGYSSVKLYFMLGLPTETLDDIKAIKELADKIIDLYYNTEGRSKKAISISISLSTFIPKPFTPFEYEPQATEEQINERQKYLLDIIGSKGRRRIDVSWSHYDTTILEAVLARGDRKLSAVIYEAWKNGCKLDGWNEYFKPDIWNAAFEKFGIDKAFYANRKREYDEIAPWEHMDMLFDRSFLVRENIKAHEEKTTANCREKCAGCGINKCLGRACFKYE